MEQEQRAQIGDIIDVAAGNVVGRHGPESAPAPKLKRRMNATDRSQD